MPDPYANFNAASQKRNVSNAFLGNAYVDTYLVSNGTISSSNSGQVFNTEGSNIVELHIVVGSITSSPSVVFTITPIDPASSTPLSSSKVSTSAVTSAGDSEIILSAYAGKVLGSQIQVSWTFSGSGSLNGTYVRLLARR